MSDHPPLRSFSKTSATIQVQTVLYGNAFAGVERAVLSLGRAAELAIAGGMAGRVQLVFGDCSTWPCMSAEDIAGLRALYPHALGIAYEFFGGNLGSARGHNRLAEAAMTDFILVQNPDVVVSPRLLVNLLAAFEVAGTGIAEAKQLPIEHPKDYDPQTGETAWATTACAMIPLDLFREIGGFDADSFFLYCDDVDFSWEVRCKGYKVIFQPGAVVFHDKRLSDAGKWQPSDAERYYSAEAALILAHKWSRPELVEKILAEFRGYGDPISSRAVAVYEARRGNKTLPAPRDPDHRIGQFISGMYAAHRYPL